MLLKIEHTLVFAYDSYISESFLELRVQPKATSAQTVASFSLAVGPPTRVFRYRDWNDNLAHHFTVTKFHDRIEVVSDSLVETHAGGLAPNAITEAPPTGEVPFTLRDFVEFGGPVRLTPALREVHRAIATSAKAPVGEQVTAIGAHLHREFDYQRHVTRYDSTTDDFLKGRAGVCQDFAHLALALLRLRGIPCRYVSGYLHVERAAREAAQSHAWIEFHTSLGWVPFDPTQNVTPDDRYVVVGHGRHYDDVPPNRGIYRGAAKETLTAQVRTEQASGRAPAAFQEDVVTIELPVFTEIPQRRLERPATPAEAAAESQQQ